MRRRTKFKLPNLTRKALFIATILWQNALVVLLALMHKIESSIAISLLIVLLLALATVFVFTGMGMELADADSEDDLDERLKVLRREFYSAREPALSSLSSQRVYIALRDITEPLHAYYYSMMLAERATYRMLNKTEIRGLKNPQHLLKQVQQLSRHIAVLVDQIQTADQLLLLYRPESDEMEMVERIRQRLTRRADRAMRVLEGVPARLLNLSTAANQRGAVRLQRQLENINTRLEGMADAYVAMQEPEFIELERMRQLAGRS